MGTWGYGPFDSDYAQDFLGDLAGERDIVDRLRRVLARVADETGMVEVHAGEEAAAAAALVAVRSGGVVVDPETAEDLSDFTFQCPEDLPSLAARAFDRLLEPDHNEWYGLWVESNAIDQVAAEFEPYRRAISGTRSDDH